MPNAVMLNVNGIRKKSTEINYEDLVWLYREFEKNYGRLPTTNDGKAIYNLPQQRIIKKILLEKDITYNDFMLQFGKVSHVRTESQNYEKFINRYKEVSNSIGRALTTDELINNIYGLPSASWLVKHCPDVEVKTYSDFVSWLGYKSNELKRDKEDVINKLKKLEEKLNRPLVRTDITVKNLGFSNIVISRLWGNWGNCKKELGLLKTLPTQPKPFSYYKKLLDDILIDLTNNTDRTFITWKDIEQSNINVGHTEHKTFSKAFEREGVNIFSYIKSKGFMMNPSNFSFHYTFSDGERVVSAMEYDFSKFLKDNGYIYGKDYQRDVMYKTFIKEESTRINCDYVFYLDNSIFYVEIPGIIHNKDNNWEYMKYSSKQEQNYQLKMLKKQELLKKTNSNYLFLFPEDFEQNKYQDIFFNFINSTNGEVA